MKHTAITLACLGTAIPALAETNWDAVDRENPHSFGVQVPLWFNASLSMHGKSDSRSGTITGDPNIDGRQDRYYADGFNRLNAAGNPTIATTASSELFPRTTYFGFQDNRQVTPPVFGPTGNLPGSLSLHDVNLVGGQYTSALANGDQNPGVELFYRYRWKNPERWTLDLEAGVSWQTFDWSQSGAVDAVAAVDEDRYPTGTVDPRVFPGSGGTLPYAGPYQPVGGTPWIGSVPSRQPTAHLPASVDSRRDMELDSWVGRIGPAAHWRFHPRWRLGALVGLAVGYSDASYSFRDRISVNSPTVPVLVQQGQGGFSDVWFGLYSALRLTYRLSERWDVLVEGRHLWTEKQSHDAGTRVLRLDLSDGVAVSIGAAYRF